MAAHFRRAPALVATVILLASAAALIAPTASAQAIEDVEELDIAITVAEGLQGADYIWQNEEFTAPAGSNVLLMYNSAGAEAQHNVRVTEGAQAFPPTPPPLLPDSGVVYQTFTMPESGEVTFVCDVHPQTMVGTIAVGPAFTAPGGGGGGAGVQVNALGVSFLAHWVGVIAFAVMFVIYGLTFFLFKYNESGFTTDHKDRAVPAGATGGYGEPFLTSRNFVTLLVVLTIVLVLAFAYLLTAGYFV